MLGLNKDVDENSSLPRHYTVHGQQGIQFYGHFSITQLRYVIRHTGSVISPYTYHKESEQFLDKTRDDNDEHVMKPAARFELRVTIYKNK